MDLCSFLCRQCGASAAICELVRRQSQELKVPIGRIFVRARMLTVKQLMELLHEQVESPGLRLGELGVRKGWLSSADVREALDEQARESPHQAALLLNALPSGDWQEAMIAYIRHLESRVQTSGSPDVCGRLQARDGAGSDFGIAL